MTLGTKALASHGVSAHPPRTGSGSRSTPTARRRLEADLAVMRRSGIQAILPEIFDGRHAYFPSQRLPVRSDLLGRFSRWPKPRPSRFTPGCGPCPASCPRSSSDIPTGTTSTPRANPRSTSPPMSTIQIPRPRPPRGTRLGAGHSEGISQYPRAERDSSRLPAPSDAILPKGLWSKYEIIQDKVYPQYDYGYSPYERDQFKKKYGVDPSKSQRTNQRSQARARMVPVPPRHGCHLVDDHLVPAAHAKGKMITAAVFPGPTLAREMVRQDWARFQLDASCPCSTTSSTRLARSG